MKHKIILVLSLLVLGSLLLTTLVLAQGELNSKGLILSSGGPVSAGGLTLRTAVGLPVFGQKSGAGLSICSGLICGGQTSRAQAVYLPLVFGR
jgi:hypothetical protein